MTLSKNVQPPLLKAVVLLTKGIYELLEYAYEMFVSCTYTILNTRASFMVL